MAWFEEVFGFKEGDYESTRSRFLLEPIPADNVEDTWSSSRGVTLLSKANGARFHVGPFECLSVAALRVRLQKQRELSDDNKTLTALGSLAFSNMVGDVRTLHKDKRNAGAVFQV